MHRMLRRTIGDQIAAAIREADTRYFFEDYTKQANAVLDAIDEAGFVLVRREPSAPMLEAGMKALAYGRQNKEHVLKSLYRAMIEESLKHPD